MDGNKGKRNLLSAQSARALCMQVTSMVGTVVLRSDRPSQSGTSTLFIPNLTRCWLAASALPCAFTRGASAASASFC